MRDDAESLTFPPKPGWADEVVFDLCNKVGEYNSDFTPSQAIAAALRKAAQEHYAKGRAAGMREAATEADRDTDENGSIDIRPYHDIAAALRKAAQEHFAMGRVVGLREAAEIMMDETLEGDWGTGVELIRARADEIEKGGA